MERVRAVGYLSNCSSWPMAAAAAHPSLISISHSSGRAGERGWEARLAAFFGRHAGQSG